MKIKQFTIIALALIATLNGNQLRVVPRHDSLRAIVSVHMGDKHQDKI